MSAPQDAWAGPLAKETIDAWRSGDLAYIRTSPGTYDETTGTIGLTETTIPAAGAVVKTMQEERDGVMQTQELIAWIDHTTVAWPISTDDRLDYLGKRWKITGIDPTYSSGQQAGSVYASKVTARAE